MLDFELATFDQSFSLSQNLLCALLLLPYFVPDLHFLTFLLFDLLKQLVQLKLEILIFSITNIDDFLFFGNLFTKRFVFLFFDQFGEAFSLLDHISSLPKILGIRIYLDV